MTSPSGRRAAIRALTCRGISERRACQILGLSRRVSSYALRQPGKDQALGTRLMDATQDVPRFGYRRMAAWLDVGEARVRRLWCSLGLHQPRKRPRRRRSGCDMRLPGAVRPVYKAFDEGEYVHSGDTPDVDVENKYTKPMIAAILAEQNAV